MRVMVVIFIFSVLRLQAQPLAVKEAIDRWVKMWNSYDLLEVDSLFDNRATYFSSEFEGLITGLDQLCAHHQKFGFVPGGRQTGNVLWLENESVQTAGSEVVVITATWFFQRKDAIRPQRGPVTFVLNKLSGKWKIIHAHFANNP